MKKLFILMGLMLLASSFTFGQKNWGVGLRLGDPTGITAKKYLGKNALEISLGQSYLFYGNGYYDKNFDYWYKGKKNGYNKFEYLGYSTGNNFKRPVPIAIQVHYLFHNPISKVDGLDWYWGLGGQLRFQNYNYAYRYKVDGNSNWIYVNNERVTDLDLGVDGVIGMEYTFKDVPLSIFLDVNLFLEIVDSPFMFWMQGGAGIRYNF